MLCAELVECAGNDAGCADAGKQSSSTKIEQQHNPPLSESNKEMENELVFHDIDIEALTAFTQFPSDNSSKIQHPMSMSYSGKENEKEQELHINKVFAPISHFSSSSQEVCATEHQQQVITSRSTIKSIVNVSVGDSSLSELFDLKPETACSKDLVISTNGTFEQHKKENEEKLEGREEEKSEGQEEETSMDETPELCSESSGGTDDILIEDMCTIEHQPYFKKEDGGELDTGSTELKISSLASDKQTATKYLEDLPKSLLQHVPCHLGVGIPETTTMYDTSDSSTGEPNINCGLQTATGRAVTMSPQVVNQVFCSNTQQPPSTFPGLMTAAGSIVTVSSQALEHVRGKSNLPQQCQQAGTFTKFNRSTGTKIVESPQPMDHSPNKASITFSGLMTAAGEVVPVSSQALERVRSKFADHPDSVSGVGMTSHSVVQSTSQSECAVVKSSSILELIESKKASLQPSLPQAFSPKLTTASGNKVTNRLLHALHHSPEETVGEGKSGDVFVTGAQLSQSASDENCQACLTKKGML